MNDQEFKQCLKEAKDWLLELRTAIGVLERYQGSAAVFSSFHATLLEGKLQEAASHAYDLIDAMPEGITND